MSSDEDFPSPSKKKPRQVYISEVEVCIIHCSTDTGQLISPTSLDSWSTLLDAAKVRNHQALLNIASNTPELTIPAISYHRKCRCLFTMKSKLEQLQKSKMSELAAAAESDEITDVQGRPSTRSTSQLQAAWRGKVLPAACVFCKKSKYRPGTHTREAIIMSCEDRSDSRLRYSAGIKVDSEMLTLLATAHDSAAIEVHYHMSCYRKYNKAAYRNEPDRSAMQIAETSYEEAECTAFEKFVERIEELISNKEICEFTDLQTRYESELLKSGVDIITPSHKKNLRRKIISRFGNQLHFVQKPSGRLLVYPNSISTESLVLQNVELKETVENLLSAATVHNICTKAALIIRNDIRSLSTSSLSDAPATENMLPESAGHFLQVMLTGDLLAPTSPRVKRLIWSYGQDFINGVTVARIKTPKHVLLPYAVKTLTGNVRLMTYLNRLGHGLSYSQIEEIETSVALQKIAESAQRNFTLPDSLLQSKFTHLAWDNIDRCEETLSGGGTSHRVNGIIVQPQVTKKLPESIVILKGKKRSLDTNIQVLQPYLAGSRLGPGTVSSDDLYVHDDVRSAKMQNLSWIVKRCLHSSCQMIPSWTGFNVLARENIPVKVSTIRYLPTVNFPATELTTVQEVLRRSVSIKEQLKLTSIACTFDQALYAKAAEIVWKHSEEFEGIVLQLGGFHILCNFLSILGKRFGDAGLRDVLVEGNVAAAGSASSILSGKQYNRGIRMHKLLYEALHRTMLLGLADWVKLKDAQLADSIAEIMTSEDATESEIHVIAEAFMSFEDYLRTDNGPTSALWMSYVDMVDTLLNLIRATREGNWVLYLSSIRRTIPWFFAYDHQNYARYLPVYYYDMLSLKSTHPDMHEAYHQGNFSVQLDSSNSFARLPVDEVIEKTVNLDTQTAGGTKGFSRKPSAVERFYLTSNTRAAFLSALNDVSHTKNTAYKHADLYPSRILKDEESVQSLCTLLSKEWINPFVVSTDMVVLSTGVRVPKEIADDLLLAEEKGANAFTAFTQANFNDNSSTARFHDRIPKLRLRTCSDICRTKKVKISGRELVLRADRGLFAKMAVIAQKRSLNMREVLSFPLGPVPMSLGNPDGSMRKTQKSSLLIALCKGMPAAEGCPPECACIMDGMSLVQKFVSVPETFGQLADKLLNMILADVRLCKRIDVVFDVYRDESIKNAERSRRAKSGKVKEYHNITENHKIREWKAFLTSGCNKSVLVQFCVDYWSQHRKKMNMVQEFYCTRNDKCVRITAEGVSDIPELATEQEEADTRMLLHAKHAADCGYKHVVIQADDTDVAIIGLRFVPDITSSATTLYLKMGTRSCVRYINLTDLHEHLNPSVCAALVGLHALTGCDTVSSFCGKGKNRAFTCLKRNLQFLPGLQQLGKDFTVSDDLFNDLKHFVCKMYGASGSDVNDVRYVLFCKKKGCIESQNLPPCEDCLQLHIKRANYQAGIWQRSLEAHPSIPRPINHGWILINGMLDIQWMSCETAPAAVLELLSCTCKKECRASSCPCIIHGLKCTDMCTISKCVNVEDEHSEVDTDNDCDIDIASDSDSSDSNSGQ